MKSPVTYISKWPGLNNVANASAARKAPGKLFGVCRRTISMPVKHAELEAFQIALRIP